MFALGRLDRPHPHAAGGGVVKRSQMRQPLTIKYAKTNGFHQKERNASTTTHLSKLYGILSVPDALRAQFDALHAKDFEQGSCLLNLLAAISPAGFPFVLDLDTPDGGPSREEMLSLCVAVAGLLPRFFGIDPVTAPPVELKRFGYVVAMCPDSSNVHMHFPGLVVDQATAIRLTTLLPDAVQELRVPWFEAMSKKGREKLFDLNVVTALGLRTIFSHKIGSCPMCEGDGCDHCFGAGKVQVGGHGRVYDLEYMATTPNQRPVAITKSRVPPSQRLMLTRVYITKQELESAHLPLQPLKLSAVHLELLNEEREERACARAHIKPLVQPGSAQTLKSSKRKRKRKPLRPSHTLPAPVTDGRQLPGGFKRALLTAIHHIDKELFGGVKIKNVRRSNTHLIVDVSNPRPLGCLNNGAVSHRQRQIYFQVDLSKETVCQRCRCGCDRIGLSGGPCRNFKSDPSRLELPDDLFAGTRSASYIGRKHRAQPDVVELELGPKRQRKSKPVAPAPAKHKVVIPLSAWQLLARTKPKATVAEQRAFQAKLVEQRAERQRASMARKDKWAKARHWRKRNKGRPVDMEIKASQDGSHLCVNVYGLGERAKGPVRSVRLLDALSGESMFMLQESAMKRKQEMGDPDEVKLPRLVFKSVAEKNSYDTLMACERMHGACLRTIVNTLKAEDKAAKAAGGAPAPAPEVDGDDAVEAN